MASSATHKLYRALGVEPGASVDEIKRAYKRLALQHHPDRGGDQDAFKEISHAHEVLSDDEKRRRYDALGDHGGGNGGGGGDGAAEFAAAFNMQDIFSQMFGSGGHGFQQQRQQQSQGQRTVRALQVDLKDVFTGFERVLPIQVMRPCETCLRPCGACRGQGQVTRVMQLGPGFQQHVTAPCDACRGEGKQHAPGCATCEGRGKVQVNQSVHVVVPRGCANGHEFAFPGVGVSPRDVLVLKLSVRDDPAFDRVDNDLHFRAAIMFADSVLGAKVPVPWFGGEFDVDTRGWGVVHPGRKYMVPGKGMPSPSGGQGNLVVTFDVTYPSTALSDAQVEALAPLLRGLA